VADYTFDSDAEGASASGLPQQTGLTAYAASAFHGARGVRSAGSGTEGRARFAPTGTSVGVREYFRFAGATPGVIAALMWFHAAGTVRVGSVEIQSDSRIRFSDASGLAPAKWTSTTTIAADTWYRLEVTLTCGATTSTGSVKLGLYLGDSTTALETYTATDLNTGAGLNLLYAYVGKFGTAAATPDFDSMGYVEPATDLIGRYTPGAASLVRPLSVLSNTGGISVGGTGASTLTQALSTSDASYLVNPDSASNESVTFRLPPLTVGTSVIETPRWGLWPGSASVPMRVEVLQGAAVVCSDDFTVTSETPASVSVTLSAPEVAAITDWTDLSMRITWKVA